MKTKPNSEAIEVLKKELERREQRLIDIRKHLGDDYEKGLDRDQFNYCLGRADEVRHLLSCLGEHNWEVKTTVEMKKALGWR